MNELKKHFYDNWFQLWSCANLLVGFVSGLYYHNIIFKKDSDEE